MSREKRKIVSSCLGIIYLAPGISNPVGAKLSRWHLGINYFGANWDLRRNCTQRGHCLAGAKLSRWYFGLIPLGANLALQKVLHYVDIHLPACKFGPLEKSYTIYIFSCWREIISLLACKFGSS